MLNEEAFIKAVQKKHAAQDLTVLGEAYRYAKTAHQGQMRKSGVPYFVHPVEVALILNEMNMDIPSIAAGLLHDTVEDTTVALKEIEKRFGAEIAFLVDGVTKLDKIVFTSREDKQAENFRKMIVAMSKDIRVILIKLADRLNNMRTIRYLAPNKRVEIAQETADIYAPLANRLGMSKIKMELQDLSLLATKPDIAIELGKKLTAFAKNRQNYIRKVERKLCQKFDECLPKYEVTHRIKHLASVYSKMESQNLAFEQVHDLLGFRVIVQTIAECYEAMGHIHSLWKPIPGRIKDYLAMPKANNYQSLHTTVICEDGLRVEFQIRTFEMHDIAEQGIAAHWHYKEGNKLGEKDANQFQWLRQLMSWKNEMEIPEEFLDSLKHDLFTNEVYVFTPKGEVRELPYGSTPVDFAYLIHSEVGNHCVGAKINDRIVPLTSVLKSGDVVEILTSQSAVPNKDWLRFSKMSKAGYHIRRFIREEQRSRSIEIGRELLEKELDKFDLSLNRFLNSKPLEKALKTFPLHDTDALLTAIGYGKLSPLQVIAKVIPKEKLEAPKAVKPVKEGIIQQIFKKVAKRGKSLIKVSGLSNVLVSFGKCCHPLPGDSIVGFVTRGRGVRVHIKHCSTALSMDPARRIEVEWGEVQGSAELPSVRIRVLSEDKPGILSQITKEISDSGVNISGARIRTTRDAKAVSIIELEIPHLDRLHQLMRTIEKIDGIIGVERVKA